MLEAVNNAIVSTKIVNISSTGTPASTQAVFFMRLLPQSEPLIPTESVSLNATGKLYFCLHPSVFERCGLMLPPRVLIQSIQGNA